LKFLTGPVAHTAIFGLDYQHINYNELYNTYLAAPSIHVFNPVYGAAIAKAAPSGSDDAPDSSLRQGPPTPRLSLPKQPVGWNSFVTAALFDLTQQNVLTSDSAHPTFSVQTGAIRSRGLELEWHANLNKNLEVVAAYTYLDNIVTQANDTDLQYGLDVGTHPPGIPRNAASLWSKYSFRDGPANGLALGGGVRFVGESYGTYTNVWDNVPGLSSTPSIVPGYTLFDALVSYDFGAKYAGLKGFSATVNARNLFDKIYVAYCQSVAACQYGLGRTVIGTLAYRW
jgi:iron complex outermembrane recepter protein